MPLADPRQGASRGFHLYSNTMNEGTLGEPETIIWSAIRHLCSQGVAERVAQQHRPNTKKQRDSIGRNLKLYVRQASEFYDAARAAKPNTAPLIYYYSFLNLSKALCELSIPNFHRRPECYKHGLTWIPDRRKLANPQTEAIRVSTRGVWHVLWESLTGLPCPAQNPTILRIKDLFSFCPEVSVETESTLGENLHLLQLKSPDVLYDLASGETWLRFSLYREHLGDLRLPLSALIARIQTPRSGYSEVKSADRSVRTLQSTIPLKFPSESDPLEFVIPDITALNGFAYPGREKALEYFIPVQSKLPFLIPQLVINYSILFWLGSLVRYDPHSVDALMDSEYWMLIDGFISQSRLWLLELFHWALYKAEVTLWISR